MANPMMIAMAALAAVQVIKGIADTKKADRKTSQLEKEIKDSRTPPEYAEAVNRAKIDEKTGLTQTEMALGKDSVSQQRIDSTRALNRSQQSPGARVATALAINKGANDAELGLIATSENIKRQKRGLTNQLLINKGQAEKVTDENNLRRTMIKYGMAEESMRAGSESINAGLSNAIGAIYYGNQKNLSGPTTINNPNSNLNEAVNRASDNIQYSNLKNISNAGRTPLTEPPPPTLQSRPSIPIESEVGIKTPSEGAPVNTNVPANIVDESKSFSAQMKEAQQDKKTYNPNTATGIANKANEQLDKILDETKLDTPPSIYTTTSRYYTSGPDYKAFHNLKPEDIDDKEVRAYYSIDATPYENMPSILKNISGRRKAIAAAIRYKSEGGQYVGYKEWFENNFGILPEKDSIKLKDWYNNIK